LFGEGKGVKEGAAREMDRDAGNDDGNESAVTATLR